MFRDFPFWPAVSFGECETLMDVDAIEHFAPNIEAEIDDDTSLAEARKIVGGEKAFCHRERKRNEAAGLVAVNSHKRED